MEGISIPADLLAEFRNGSPGPGPENGIDSAASGMAIKSMEKSLAWLVKVGDDFAKNRDLPGLGGMSNEEFAELATIVVERNFGASFLENSPEFLFGSVTLGILISNMVAHNRNQQEKKEQAEKQKKEQANEQ